MEEQTFNLTSAIQESINSIFSNFFSSIDNNIYLLLDKLTFIDTSIFNKLAIQKLLGENINSGILLICNALVIGFILYYAINFLFSHLTYVKVQSPSQFIFRCIIFLSLMNSSFWICKEIINIISIVTELIKSYSHTFFREIISFSSFIDRINEIMQLSNTNFSIISFDGIIKSFCSIGLINLLFTYSLRYIMIQVFIIISPFAFLCLISDNTTWFFKSWLRSFTSLLLVQVLISIILSLAFAIGLDNSTLSKILIIGVIFALTKANTYMAQIFGSISADISSGISNMQKLTL